MINSRIITADFYQGNPLLNQHSYTNKGYYETILEAVKQRVDYMQINNSKTLAVHLVLSFPTSINASVDNYCFQKCLEEFVRYLRNQSKRVNKRAYCYPQYIWCREKNSSHNHHYHLYLLLNENAIQQCHAFSKCLEPLTRYWSRFLNRYYGYIGNAKGLVHFSTHGISGVLSMVRGNDIDRQVVFQIGSYLAKVNTKELDPSTFRFWNCSQLPNQ